MSALTASLLLVATLLGSIPAKALEFQCAQNGDIRYLRVDIPGEDHLCEVSVKYQYTGEKKVMWYADNDSLFCSARAYELKDKYENTWNFDCAAWPDADGIDKLSPSHRSIVDLQLKIQMTQGENAVPPFKVTGVRAAASTPLDNQPGTLALQFFLSDGSDKTQIIVDEKDTWDVYATIDDLTSQVSSDAPIRSALVSAITESAALEVVTTVADGPNRDCRGKQVLLIDNDKQLVAHTTHRFVCYTNSVAVRSPD